MKKYYSIITFLFFILILITLSGCSNINKTTDNSEYKTITSVVNEYYFNLERNEFEKALYLVDFSNEDKENSYISLEKRLKVLENMMSDYFIEFYVLEPCDTSKVYYSKDEKMMAAYIALEIKDHKENEETLNEVLYLKKIDGKWKINKIESSDDILLPYRSNNYIVR